MSVTFFAAGKPATKGSTKSFRNPRTGAIVTMGDNPRTKSWQGVIATAAVAAGVRKTEKPGAVRVGLVFVFSRPKGHWGTGRNADKLKPSAPEQHTTKPDADKLARAVLDGLTRVAWVDDAQVCELRAVKRYALRGEPEGVEVTLS